MEIFKMVLFTWNAQYSVGVRELDAQHKTLVDLLNVLYDAMNSGKSNEVLGKIINKLVHKNQFSYGFLLNRKSSENQNDIQIIYNNPAARKLLIN